MYLLPLPFIRSVLLAITVLAAAGRISGITINESLIEAALLINLTSSNNNDQVAKRRFSNVYSEIDVNLSTEIDSEIADANQSQNDAIENSFKIILTSYPNENKSDAIEYAINYLSQNKVIFNLTNEKFLSTIESIFSALIETTEFADLTMSFQELPLRILGNLIPKTVNSWGQNAANWSGLLAEVFIDSISNSSKLNPQEKLNLQAVTIKSTISGVLSLIDEGEDTAIGFSPGIEEITDLSQDNLKMGFGGPYTQFKKFDESKTIIVYKTTSGLSKAIFKNIGLSNGQDSIKEDYETYTNILATNSIEGALEYLLALENEDHSLFAYELSKVIANSLSYNAVLDSTTRKNFNQESLPSYVAEKIAKSVASKSVGYLLENGARYDISNMAQSVSFGSAQGSQLASVNEKALDYPDNWAVFSRKEIAKKSSEGSSYGAVNMAASKYISPDLYTNGEKPSGNTNWKDILNVAQGTSMGSLTANTAMSVYFPAEQESIINFSSHGTTYGSVSAESLSLILPEPNNPTSEIKVDVARASAIGATTAATFEIVSLLDAKPHLDTADINTLKTIEAATYGTTYGAIQAGTESLNSDAVMLKQASKQGATSGSLNGIGLGLGKPLEEAVNVDLNSKAAVLQTITNTNSIASTNASRSIATKSIKTSSSDMLLLMRKFNISPKFTNPTRIYKDTNSKIDSSDIPTAESTIEFASPI